VDLEPRQHHRADAASQERAGEPDHERLHHERHEELRLGEAERREHGDLASSSLDRHVEKSADRDCYRDNDHRMRHHTEHLIGA